MLAEAASAELVNWVLGISALAVVGMVAWGLITLVSIKGDVAEMRTTTTALKEDFIADQAERKANERRVEQRFQWGTGALNKIRMGMALMQREIKGVVARLRELENGDN